MKIKSIERTHAHERMYLFLEIGGKQSVFVLMFICLSFLIVHYVLWT